MKIYRTNQESIDKGILKELVPNSYIRRSGKLIQFVDWHTFYVNNQIEVYIDNRIKGFCLKEYK